MSIIDMPHPYSEVCRQAGTTPAAARRRFPGHRYQAVAWVMDRWVARHPGSDRYGPIQVGGQEYGLLRLGALERDYWTRATPRLTRFQP